MMFGNMRDADDISLISTNGLEVTDILLGSLNYFYNEIMMKECLKTLIRKVRWKPKCHSKVIKMPMIKKGEEIRQKYKKIEIPNYQQKTFCCR